MTIDADQLALALPFAGSLQPATRARLGEQVRVQSVPPFGLLLQPGDRVSGAYFVASGSIRVYYLDADGHEGTLYRIESGQSCVLALNCLFSAMRYPAWAEAGDKGVTFAALDGITAGALMREDGSFMTAMFEQVSTRLYGLLTTLEQAIRLPLEARLVRLLLDLADGEDTVHLSQERIAAHLGTSREVVSRLVRALAGRGLVASAYGKITLVNRAVLLERCG
jgi:CRP/FNR family transcriptional regulator